MLRGSISIWCVSLGVDSYTSVCKDSIDEERRAVPFSTRGQIVEKTVNMEEAVVRELAFEVCPQQTPYEVVRRGYPRPLRG